MTANFWCLEKVSSFPRPRQLGGDWVGVGQSQLGQLLPDPSLQPVCVLQKVLLVPGDEKYVP